MSRYSHNLTTPSRDPNPPDSISHPQLAPNSYLSDHPIPTTKTSFLETPTFNFHPNSPSYLHSPTHISFLSQQPYLLIPPLQVQLNPLLRERDVRVNVARPDHFLLLARRNRVPPQPNTSVTQKKILLSPVPPQIKTACSQKAISAHIAFYRISELRGTLIGTCSAQR